MVKGVGVDMVKISTIRQFLSEENVFIKHTFTETEIKNAQNSRNLAEYFASRFAVKEAAYKAISSYIQPMDFDLRIIETLNTNKGCPFISITEELKEVISGTDINTLFVTITHEDDYAVAFVIAE